MKYRAYDAFSGAGGLSLGLQWAGFDVVGAFDNNKDAVATYNKNMSGCRCVDAREASEKHFGSEPLSLFAGGPSCQGFSIQNKQGGSHDARNQMAVEFCRMVAENRPQFFLLENVKMFAGKRGEQIRAKMDEMFGEYELHGHLYNAADYGVAQLRKRYIIVGKRKDVPGEFTIPEPTASTWVTVGEAIGDLPEPPDSPKLSHPDYPNHSRGNVSAINVERFSHVPQGGGWRDIPEALRYDCHKDNPDGGRWGDVFGRLEENGQAPTLICAFQSFTRGRYGHFREDRPITPREGARLQGFPDSFIFTGCKTNACKQIGNAVPPLLAEAIGNAIMVVLKKA